MFKVGTLFPTAAGLKLGAAPVCKEEEAGATVCTGSFKMDNKILKKNIAFSDELSFTRLQWLQPPNLNQSITLAMWSIASWKFTSQICYKCSAALSIWMKVPGRSFQPIFKFMPRKIEAILKARRGPTQFK